MAQEKERLDRDFLKEDAILKLLGISKGTLDRLINKKDFPYIKIGQERLFYEQDVISWLRHEKSGYNSEELV